MMARCYKRNRNAYPYYGGKGIKVCGAWLGNFAEFKKWALLNGYRDDLELDRKDGSKDYSPENCRWVTRAEQMKNRVFSEAGRKRISDLKKLGGKPVRCVETSLVFPNIVSACRHFNVSSGLISHVLAGRNKTACGYHWEYV